MTPYQTRCAVYARSRRQNELAMLSGWWSEVTARQDRLRSPDSYFKPGPPEADQEQAFLATMSRIAAAGGRTLEPCGDEEEG